MECFGESSSDDEASSASGDGPAAAVARRDESCGVCRFHPNTEASLLAHVRNALGRSSEGDGDGDADRSRRRCDEVLRAIDDFCTERHWMMHVGPEKGGMLTSALREATEGKMRKRTTSSSMSFVAVELGTYCGYASVLMGRAMRESSAKLGDGLDYRLYTTEISREYADVASEIIRLAGMDDLVSVHRISYDGHDTDLIEVVRGAISGDDLHGGRDVTIDFLFVDHDKDSYLPDLIKLEASGMIQRGTRVVADNVVFACIDDYVGYVKQKEKDGVVETKTVPCRVEYSGEQGDDSQPYEDGVEITDYLHDPETNL